MSITCKTGCGQQVVYENIEFTDGFVYHCPHNLDSSLHYCPIFHSPASLFGHPFGGYPFDANPFRENSYGNEIEKLGQIFYEFDELIMSKNKSLSVEDIRIYKTRLHSFLNMLPINGLYTDATDGLVDYDRNSYEKALASGALNNRYIEYYESPEFNLKNYQFYTHFTLSSQPITALKKIYYVLEGESKNFKTCQQLEKEISENSPDYKPNYEENPFELQLIDALKQLEFFQNKLKNNPLDKDKENKINDVIKYYHELIDGIPLDEWDTRKHIFNGAGSNGIKDEIRNWYDNKKRFLKITALSEKLKVSYDEAETLYDSNWDYMDSDTKKEHISLYDEYNEDEKSKIISSTYQEIESSFPNLVKEFLEIGIFGSESSRQIVNEKLKKVETRTVTPENDGFFNIVKIRELIFKNARDQMQEMIEDSVIIDNEEASVELSSEYEYHEPSKYDFETHFNHNSIVHLSKTEKNLRQLIISGIYDNDVDFLKKHFKTLWEQIIDTKLRSEKNIRKPKEDTELDYATFGQLLDILKNKETQNRVKIKKIDAYDSLIKNIDLLLPLRNELDHVRGTVDGDLEISAKCIVVGICTHIDEFCSEILYR
jgi:hypothetical protein